MLKSPQSIDSIVTYAMDNDINILFVQVRGRGTVFYTSNFEEFENRESNFDALAYLLTRTKSTNIKVHAWFNLYLIWSKSEKPGSPMHPMNKFNYALLKDYNFESFDAVTKNGNGNGGIEGYYLSPFHSDVNQYLTQMVKELILKYKVDGIHFDYIRYPNSSFICDEGLLDYISNKYGFSPLLLKRYPDSAVSMYKGNDYFENLNKVTELYSRTITEFLKNIYLWVNKNFPKVLVSAAVKPDPVQAKTRFYQDWSLWLNENYIDFVVVMNYSRDNRVFSKNLETIKNNVDISRIMVGLAAYNKNRIQLKEQIKIARGMQFNSFSVFSYKHIKNEKIAYLLHED